jgi:hypothetical protein
MSSDARTSFTPVVGHLTTQYVHTEEPCVYSRLNPKQCVKCHRSIEDDTGVCSGTPRDVATTGIVVPNGAVPEDDDLGERYVGIGLMIGGGLLAVAMHPGAWMIALVFIGGAVFGLGLSTVVRGERP